jgi:Uma2 family endonuclease
MSGVSDAHDRVQVNATVALANRLRGGRCRVRGADLRVCPDETGLYCYPDLTIVCGEPVFAATRPVTLLNPRVIIEVLSETTEEYDRGAKIAHYRHRASVDLILLIDSQRRMVERQQRNPDGTWTLSEHTRGTVALLEHEVPLDELYDGVVLTTAPVALAAKSGAGSPAVVSHRRRRGRFETQKPRILMRIRGFNVRTG